MGWMADLARINAQQQGHVNPYRLAEDVESIYGQSQQPQQEDTRQETVQGDRSMKEMFAGADPSQLSYSPQPSQIQQQLSAQQTQQSPADPQREMALQYIKSRNPALQKIGLESLQRMSNKAIDAPAAGRGWDVNEANTYRDDATKAVSDDKARIGAFEKMKLSAVPDRNGNYSPASDKSLVYQFAKILDPRGIVTEKDFENARSSGNLDSQVQGFLSQMINGVLPDHIRQDIVNAASSHYNTAISGLAETQDIYRNMTTEAGIPLAQLGFGNKTYSPYVKKMIDNIKQGETPENIVDVLKVIGTTGSNALGFGSTTNVDPDYDLYED